MQPYAPNILAAANIVIAQNGHCENSGVTCEHCFRDTDEGCTFAVTKEDARTYVAAYSNVQFLGEPQ